MRLLRSGRGTSDGSVYELLVPPSNDTLGTTRLDTSILPNQEGGAALLYRPCRTAPDLWRRGGLGPSGWLVWIALGLRSFPSAAALATAIHMYRRTVERCLTKLALFELAVRDETGWHRGTSDPEEVVQRNEFRRVGGAGERQRREHEFDRQHPAYQQRLARRAQFQRPAQERQEEEHEHHEGREWSIRRRTART
jgi:hypothetical protein